MNGARGKAKGAKTHTAAAMKFEDLEDYVCIGCGKILRHTFRHLPERWSAVPNNVSVYLCDDCSAPCWDAFAAKQKEIIDDLSRNGGLYI